MLTQCVRMTGKKFFEFEKKNLLIASKAPQWDGLWLYGDYISAFTAYCPPWILHNGQEMDI